MKPKDHENFNDVYGISPLGGNAIIDGETSSVPLFWDDRVQAFISEQAIEELDDRDIGLIKADQWNKEEEFRTRAGYRRL